MENKVRERLFHLKMNFREKNISQKGFELIGGLSKIRLDEYMPYNNYVTSESVLKDFQALESYVGYLNVLMLSAMLDRDIDPIIPEDIITELTKVYNDLSFSNYLDNRLDNLAVFLEVYCSSIMRNDYFIGGFEDPYLIDRFLMLYRFRLDDEDILLIFKVMEGFPVSLSKDERINWELFLNFISVPENFFREVADDNSIFLKAWNGLGKLLNYIIEYKSLLDLSEFKHSRFIFTQLDGNLFGNLHKDLGERLIKALDKIEILIEDDRTRYYLTYSYHITNNWRSQSLEILKRVKVNVKELTEIGLDQHFDRLSLLFKEDLFRISKFIELKYLIESVEEELLNYYAQGNESTAIRIRTAMEIIQNLADGVILDIDKNKFSN